MFEKFCQIEAEHLRWVCGHDRLVVADEEDAARVALVDGACAHVLRSPSPAPHPWVRATSADCQMRDPKIRSPQRLQILSAKLLQNNGHTHLRNCTPRIQTLSSQTESIGNERKIKRIVWMINSPLPHFLYNTRPVSAITF